MDQLCTRFFSFIKYQRILHKPVKRVNSETFEKISSAYLLKIGREICD